MLSMYSNLAYFLVLTFYSFIVATGVLGVAQIGEIKVGHVMCWGSEEDVIWKKKKKYNLHANT